MAESIWDVIIIGAGPAGLSAALYTARDRYTTLVLEKFMAGGQISTTDRIENYPGIDRIDGPGLIARMQGQVETFGARIAQASEVESLTRRPDGAIAVSCGTDIHAARAVILAVGSSFRRLGVPGEEEFRSAGTGVSYCGTCDAPFFKGKDVVSVGGGNTAIEETLHLAKFCRKITLVHRRDEFRASKVLVEELLAKSRSPNSNVAIRYHAVVTGIQGQGKVQSAMIKDLQTGSQESHPCDGVFIFVGTVPSTGFLKGFLDLTPEGFIPCDPATLRTRVPGVFVAGDCRVGAAMQLATAVGDGVHTAILLKEYLRDPGWWMKSTS